jgi:hypothetical protein
MAAEESSSDLDIETAQRAADGLALALEDVGFDVGVAFPGLHGVSDQAGGPAVYLGSVTLAVAADLSAILAQAVRQGVTLPL